MSFLDPITAGGPATELKTTDAAVNVSESAPPSPGDVLTAVDGEHATWQPSAGTNAGGLQTTGDPVDVSAAAPPVVGQVLTATGPDTAVWRVPGLHYDPAVKSWTSSTGEATIEPNTWGFVLSPPGATEPVKVYVVSSLSAPPVDSRIGLYVGAAVDVPVEVHLIGASQIQDLDGSLASSITLLPNTDYEWVFYHEDGAAVWGLVSDTSRIAKYLLCADGLVNIAGSPAPVAGQVLRAIDDSNAEWSDAGGGGGGLTYAGAVVEPAPGEWILVTGSDITLPSDAEAGATVGMAVERGAEPVSLFIPSGQDLLFGNRVYDASTPFILRGGGYYEWTLQPVGESNRWLPRGMSSEQPAPLTYRASGTIMPNEWVRSSAYSDVVNLPADPRDGDSFAVLVDGEGVSLVPDTGDTIVSPNGDDVAVGPAFINVPGASYYEWLWSSADSAWVPRENMLVLTPSAVRDAIAASDTALNMSSNRIVSLGAPADDDDAATKGYVDSTITMRARGLLHRSSGALSTGDIVVASDYADAVTLPSTHDTGNVIGVYVDGASATVTAASGESVQSPVDGSLVTAPAALTLSTPGYYEWVWTVTRWSVRVGAHA